MTKRSDDIIRSLAEAQHGVVNRRQLRDAGISTDAIRARLRSGTLFELSRRVLRVAGAPETARSALMAGVLDAGPGAVVSHRSAAALWELPGFELLPAEVTGRRRGVSHGRHPLAMVHQPRLLRAHHSVVIDQIPVTTPTRVLFDLAGSPHVHPLRLERVLDTAWARGLVNHPSLAAMLGDLQQRGRPGIVLMRELIDARGVEHRPPESHAEARFHELARRVGFRDFERQVDVGSEDRWIGRVDFVDHRRRLVVEVDPALHHGSLSDRRHDHDRHERLRAAGWAVESVTERDLFHRPEELLERLRPYRWVGLRPPA